MLFASFLHLVSQGDKWMSNDASVYKEETMLHPNSIQEECDLSTERGFKVDSDPCVLTIYRRLYILILIVYQIKFCQKINQMI